ncbi:hypothetical protein [Confluentibacter sediminis]|uniref:hypothetical protein n=1 Tax=Confluentibacter sediminis TaxID=2219045 RepID=UPI000DABB521|nr:hypothetical protein [Confluentibacter sediminis]
MEETTESLKDAIKERVSNPFIGKLLLAWIIWNWKITYVTFFVSEERLSVNRLDFVSKYLNPHSIFNFLNIYFVPLLITAFLIWVAPWISNVVYYVSENRRRDREIKKKKINNEISGYKEIEIKRLELEISTCKKQLKKESEKFKELSLMAEYLSEEPNLIAEKKYEKTRTSYLNKFRNEILENKKGDKVSKLLYGFHIRDSENYFNEIDQKDLTFLITNDIVEKEGHMYYLSSYGEFISKNILYEKYSKSIPNFNHYTDINN